MVCRATGVGLPVRVGDVGAAGPWAEPDFRARAGTERRFLHVSPPFGGGRFIREPDNSRLRRFLGERPTTPFASVRLPNPESENHIRKNFNRPSSFCAVASNQNQACETCRSDCRMRPLTFSGSQQLRAGNPPPDKYQCSSRQFGFSRRQGSHWINRATLTWLGICQAGGSIVWSYVRIGAQAVVRFAE
jgi:hypothetical protein